MHFSVHYQTHFSTVFFEMIFYKCIIYLILISKVFSLKAKLSVVDGRKHSQQKLAQITDYPKTPRSNVIWSKNIMRLSFEKNSDNPTSSSSGSSSSVLVGEDAATFDLAEQKPIAWIQFLIAVSGVLGGLFYVWLYEGGPQLGQAFKDVMENIAGGDSTLAITFMLAFFAICHSGLASLRPLAEEIVGPRVWRYIFAIVSLPLAFSSIVYFINHRCYTRIYPAFTNCRCIACIHIYTYTSHI